MRTAQRRKTRHSLIGYCSGCGNDTAPAVDRETIRRRLNIVCECGHPHGWHITGGE